MKKIFLSFCLLHVGTTTIGPSGRTVFGASGGKLALGQEGDSCETLGTPRHMLRHSTCARCYCVSRETGCVYCRTAIDSANAVALQQRIFRIRQTHVFPEYVIGEEGPSCRSKSRSARWRPRAQNGVVDEEYRPRLDKIPLHQ